MKRFFLCFLLFLFSLSLMKAQVNDNMQKINSNDSILQYLSPLEYAFMMHEETKFMLRVPVFGVGAELEILPYFTWVTQAYYPLLQSLFVARYPDMYSEFRWYFGSKKLGVRNMSGNYVSAGLRSNPKSYYNTDIPRLAYYAKWGIQRRILGNGLADIGIIAGFSIDEHKGDSGFGFFIKSPASLGFGFVFGERASLDRNRLCPVMKCHEVVSFLLKINLSNIISYNSFEFPLRSEILRLNPNIAVEKKILTSSFSLNIDLLWSVNAEKSEWYDSYRFYSIYQFEGMAGVRWYYNMHRRMRLGKGGNGLSGNYFSGGFGGYFRDYHFDDVRWHEPLFPFISTGIQRTLGKRLYYDLNIGIRESGHLDQLYNLGVHKTDAEVFGNARIGVKF